MPKCLGIYIEDNIIKYAKVEKNKNELKVESSNVVFYERENIKNTIDKIIRESYSSGDTISINTTNEIYNYFDIFSELKQSDRDKSIELDFELLCGEKGYNKDSLETRFITAKNKGDNDKARIIHIATNRENLQRRISELGNIKVSTASPIVTSITNLLNVPANENAIVVNIEKETRITTILEGEIYSVDVVPNGMREILESIAVKENSMQKAYECCKNATIYTQDTQMLQLEENEYLEDIMPVLYKIVSEVKDIMGISLRPIEKIYITGLAAVINNIDLYFQEYISNAKCELLKPFFVDTATIKKPIKEYIEVNSAIALALDGLGLGHSELNFKGKKSIDLNANVDLAALEETVFGGKFLAFGTPLKAFDKFLVRIAACLGVAIIAYSVVSTSIMEQLGDKRKDIKRADEDVTAEMEIIAGQISNIKAGETSYRSLIDSITLSNKKEDYDVNTVIIPKDAIPNFLNRLVHVIPTEVEIVSIKNTSGRHIVMEAKARKHEQLGYFRAVLDVEGVLENVKSTSGLKSNNEITITIEGDLP